VQRYTLLSLRDGRLTRSEPLLAIADVEATELAWVMANESYCELWLGERLVAFIDRSAAANG